MIVGLRLKFTPEELGKHMKARAAYHRKRAEEKLPELEKAKEIRAALQVNIDPEDVDKMSKGFSNRGNHSNADDLVTSLEDSIKTHRNKALTFDMFADHLFGEDYDLSESDLVRLEFLER